jgi:hypothetical protein
MSERKRPEKKRGPKGGIEHQPGKGHDSKSGPPKKRRFARKSARRRVAEQADARRQWEVWDGLTEEQKKLRPDLQPTLPRPPEP